MEEKEIKKIDKKNRNISYIKGIAFIAILFIHLFDWGGINGSLIYTLVRKYFYDGLNVFFFVSMSGALIYLAYKDYSLSKASKRLVWRGFKLIAIYYFYNILKLFIFDFSKEPYYSSFIGSNRLNDLVNILLLKVSTSPITILFTIGALLIISPIFLYILKKDKKPKTSMAMILAGFIILSFFINTNANIVTKLLYSSGLVIFPLFIWVIPYLIGILIASIGFEKKKKYILLTSLLLSIFFIIFFIITKQPLDPRVYAYPYGAIGLKYYIYFAVTSTFVLSLFMYLFSFLQKINSNFIKKVLYIFEFIGDRTFNLYLIQWVIIDITYMLFPKTEILIFITTPFFLFLYCFKEYKKIKIIDTVKNIIKR